MLHATRPIINPLRTDQWDKMFLLSPHDEVANVAYLTIDLRAGGWNNGGMLSRFKVAAKPPPLLVLLLCKLYYY